jgi:hypothetical protein
MACVFLRRYYGKRRGETIGRDHYRVFRSENEFARQR